jgi:hypothetical protein
VVFCISEDGLDGGLKAQRSRREVVDGVELAEVQRVESAVSHRTGQADHVSKHHPLPPDHRYPM